MSDYNIRRRAALDAICDNCDTVNADCAHFPCARYIALEKLPAVEDRPRGRFIKEVIPYEGRRTITCSECGKELSTGPVIGVNYFRRGWRYCPYCGAYMENA